MLHQKICAKQRDILFWSLQNKYLYESRMYMEDELCHNITLGTEINYLSLLARFCNHHVVTVDVGTELLYCVLLRYISVCMPST
jgi:hypothetical protein